MEKRYILGTGYTIQKALQNKALLEKMLPECKVDISFKSTDMNEVVLYLVLDEMRIVPVKSKNE
ncbi:MAG: hypothetical protein AAGU32_06470 [Bacillota bacterium]